uniref:ABC transporter transmembrane domain-containing protein n=1 Tax=Treponema sp. TaxID=166 RepID=UPI00388EB976
MMIDKRLVNFSGKAKKYVYAAVLLRAAGLVSSTVFIFCAGKIITIAKNSNSFDFTAFVFPLGLMALCLLITVFSNLFASRLASLSSVKVKIALRSKIYEKLLFLGSDYYEKTTTAKIIQLAVEGVEQIETWFAAFLPQFYYSMAASVFTFAVIAFLNLKMAIALLLCVPLIPISMATVQGIAKKILTAYWAQYANLADSFLENLQGLTTLQIYEADAFKAK